MVNHSLVRTTSERPELPGEVLKCGAGEAGDQLNGSCEKLSNSYGQGGEEYTINNTDKEGQLDWSHLA